MYSASARWGFDWTADSASANGWDVVDILVVGVHAFKLLTNTLPAIHRRTATTRRESAHVICSGVIGIPTDALLPFNDDHVQNHRKISPVRSQIYPKRLVRVVFTAQVFAGNILASIATQGPGETSVDGRSAEAQGHPGCARGTRRVVGGQGANGPSGALEGVQ